MDNYPAAVAMIANDFLERVKVHLRPLPAHEQEEFLKELQSHLYEAYQQTQGDEDVARMLAVLRNLGEPADVVADRLPNAMVRSGATRNLPLYVAGGILIALFGIPLGFGGMGALVGILAALAAMVMAYYAVAGSVFVAGAAVMLAGVVRLVLPHLWDKLVFNGYIQMNSGDLLDQLPSSLAGILMILIASALVACGWGMLRVGKPMLRGLRFLIVLVFDRTRRLAQHIRRKLRPAAPIPQWTVKRTATP
jgi:uncharacterized membrane protein